MDRDFHKFLKQLLVNLRDDANAFDAMAHRDFARRARNNAEQLEGYLENRTERVAEAAGEAC